ncbi:CBS domain-containing protein [Streptomyces buecherae]|uniref:CBS domain-containing protein n=1 Tax=Streptomyces buecherae TaxID=2763006 RepID=UPI0033DA3063
MTLVRVQSRSTEVTPAHGTVADAMDTGAPRVCDDMTVEVALSVMAGARTGHLVVCDDDGPRTQLVTLGQLTAVRDSPAYTDRVQLRDILHVDGPVTPAVPTTVEAGHVGSDRRLAAPPVVEDQGNARGVLALAAH